MFVTKQHRSDLARILDANGSGSRLRAVLSPSFAAACLVRAARQRRWWQPIPRWLLLVLFGCDTSAGSPIGEGLFLPHPVGVVIGSGVEVGRNTTIYQHVTLGHSEGQYPVLGDGVYIAPQAMVLGAVSIPDGSTVPAGAVVTPRHPLGSSRR